MGAKDLAARMGELRYLEERGKADELELRALEERFAPLTPMRARHLAFDIVKAMLVAFTVAPMTSAIFGDDVATLTILLNDVQRAWECSVHEQMVTVHMRADRLSSRMFARPNVGGRWRVEERAPYEIATAIRRATEQHIAKALPLLFRDARWVLEHFRVGAETLDALVAAALEKSAGEVKKTRGAA